MKIQNVLCNPVFSAGRSKILTKILTPPPLDETQFGFVVPCDAQYLIHKTTVSFKGEHNLDKLPQNKLVDLKNDVTRRCHELGAKGFEFPQKHEGNYATQALDRLTKHKIMGLGKTTQELGAIVGSIIARGCEKQDSEALLDFADFLASDKAKPVMENESVKKALGRILKSCGHKTVKPKKDFIGFLCNNPEFLNDKVNIATYIIGTHQGTYERNIEEIKKANYGAEETSDGADQQRVTEKKTAPRLLPKGKGFEMVGGQAQAIKTIKREVIFPRRYPDFYKGIQPIKGAILYGPPGTGKSLLAKALSEECKCYFRSIGASEMTDKWVGSSEKNWRALFDELQKHQPAILFIDEADALCKKRGGKDEYGDKELNQFLKLMSDINQNNSDVFVLLATNNMEAFDEAVLRDGRFGTKIEMLPPKTEKDVEEIFNIHAENMKLDQDVEEHKHEIFKKMLEYKLTGAAIEGVLKEAHGEALERLGLFSKMENDSITPEDAALFSITSKDILGVLEKRKPKSEQHIGFGQ